MHLKLEFRLTRLIPNTNNRITDYAYVLSVVFIASVISTIFLRHVEVATRLKFFVNRFCLYSLAIIISHEFLRALPNSYYVLTLALVISTSIILGLPGIYYLNSSSEIKIQNRYTKETFIAYFLLVFGAMGIGYFFGGEYTSSVISDIGNDSGLGLLIIPVMLNLILSSRYTFARSKKVIKNTRETIRAISSVAEKGELVPIGHAGRTADIAIELAKYFRYHESEIDSLETAALLQNLGFAINDEVFTTEIDVQTRAAIVTADVIRKSEPYSRIASIIENHVIAYGAIVDELPSRNTDNVAMILKIASDYELYSRLNDSFGKESCKKISYNVENNIYPIDLALALNEILSFEQNKHLIDPMVYSFYVTESEMV